MAVSNQSVVNTNCLTLNQYTIKPLVYLSTMHKKTLSFLKELVVDNSIEISNIRFRPREFNAAVDQIELLIHKI